MNRRDFIQQSVAAVSATKIVATSAALASAADDKPVPIIDTHQHLWDLRKFKLPWQKEDSPLARNYLPDDYRKASEGLNVVKTVYMEVAVETSQLDAEAAYVIDLCKQGKGPMVAAVISGRPDAANFKEYVSKYRDSKYVKGLRRVLHEEGTKKGLCLEKSFLQGIRLLGELGLSFDICIRPEELLDAAKMIDACPNTRFILDHCGNANVQAKDLTQWRKDMAAVAERKNVVCKVSGIVASAKPGKWTVDDLAPIINHTVEVFGKDRIVFGGDWPVCTLAASFKQWVEALQLIVKSWSKDDQRKLFHDNAVRVYRLA